MRQVSGTGSGSASRPPADRMPSEVNHSPRRMGTEEQCHRRPRPPTDTAAVLRARLALARGLLAGDEGVELARELAQLAVDLLHLPLARHAHRLPHAGLQPVQALLHLGAGLVRLLAQLLHALALQRVELARVDAAEQPLELLARV